MDMKETLTLLHATIDLEINVSDLYLLYSRLYARDAGFWWQLSVEEKNHAALLRSAEHFIHLGKFPEDLLYGKLDVIREYNADILERIGRHESEPVSAEEAYHYALHIEDSAAELHFQKNMLSNSDSEVMQIFQQLCGEDKNHAQRISALMEEQGFPLPG
jgi:hypothetical protein